MEIVDAQVHLWGGLAPSAGRVDAPRFTHEELVPQMDAVGVQRAVLVPPSWAIDHNDASIAAARALPDRFAVMGRIEIEDPAVHGTLAAFTAQPGMVGVRLAFRREPHATYLADGTADWFWPEAAEVGLQVMVYAPGRLPQIAEVARRHPTLRVIVDHMGVNPEADAEDRKRQLADTVAIAELPNVAVKLSALPLYSAQPFPHRDVHELVYELVEAFGAQRCFWGSDMTRLRSYAQAVTMITDEATGLSAEQKSLVMGGALLGWLGWN